MGKFIKYGWMEGPGKGKEVPVAASQYFNRLGGHFVYINSAGHAAEVNSTYYANIFGWADTQKDASGKSSWKSSSTAAADKVFVITGVENKFWMPISNAHASANATILGKSALIQNTGATYTLIQKVGTAYNTAASGVLLIHDYDASEDLALVSINPSGANA